MHEHLTKDFLDNDSFEIENRIKNLMWTVSEDYTINDNVDVELFLTSKYIALYDAMLKGAFAKLFKKDELGLYLIKKMYLGGDEKPLVTLTQLCTQSACMNEISKQRLGFTDIRNKAFEDMVDLQFEKLAHSEVGRIKLAIIRHYIRGDDSLQSNISEAVNKIISLEENADTHKVIEVVDYLYNNYIDKSFERNNGDLQYVLDVSDEELMHSSWRDIFNDEMYSDAKNEAIQKVNNLVTNFSDLEKQKNQKSSTGSSVIKLTEEDLKKMNSFVELNYGKSYMNEKEHFRINYECCRNMHQDCTLFFTDGILHSPVMINYKYKYAEKQLDKNRMIYYDNHRTVKRNIAVLTDILKKALVMNSQDDVRRSYYGILKPERLWRVGRASSNKLFDQVRNANSTSFVVDILIDASGSQSYRQGKVALQSYIISEALSNINIPHRVLSFCTFWDYTIMRRFREYDDNRSCNANIFEYTTSSNNRDGLAIRAAGLGLMNRAEEKKILIVLSDGRPNDANLNRPMSKNPTVYVGEEAIKDTAYEVRKLRSKEVSVLGVFAGEEIDLSAEKRIFGKDFAYIRNINNFSNLVGMYLKKQIDNLAD